MDMKQVIIFGLFLVPVWTCKASPCYNEDKLPGAAERKLRSHYPQPLEPAPVDATSPPVCPVALFRPLQDTSERSLSPWRYVRRNKMDHFPSTYVEAECLCSGCILIQGSNSPVESHDYNSVPIKQSRVFLKKELCSDTKTYRLMPVTVEVAVGCTCARAKTTH